MYGVVLSLRNMVKKLSGRCVLPSYRVSRTKVVFQRRVVRVLYYISIQAAPLRDAHGIPIRPAERSSSRLFKVCAPAYPRWPFCRACRTESFDRGGLADAGYRQRPSTSSNRDSAYESSSEQRSIAISGVSPYLQVEMDSACRCASNLIGPASRLPLIREMLIQCVNAESQSTRLQPVSVFLIDTFTSIAETTGLRLVCDVSIV